MSQASYPHNSYTPTLRCKFFQGGERSDACTEHWGCVFAVLFFRDSNGSSSRHSIIICKASISISLASIKTDAVIVSHPPWTVVRHASQALAAVALIADVHHRANAHSIANADFCRYLKRFDGRGNSQNISFYQISNCTTSSMFHGPRSRGTGKVPIHCARCRGQRSTLRNG